MLGTVVRAGDLLELFEVEAPEWGATAVSRRLLITKSQAHEMLVSLEAIGLLRRGTAGRFRLGWKALTLSRRLIRSEFSAESVGLIQRLGRHLGTSVELVALDGERYVRIAGHGPAGGGRTIASDGVTASGKVILAALPDGRAAELAPHLDIERELAEVRRQGVAFEEDEDRCSVAAPVFGWDGTVLAALSTTVAASMWSTRTAILTKGIVGTARRLSIAEGPDRERRLGVTGPELVALTDGESGESTVPNLRGAC